MKNATKAFSLIWWVTLGKTAFFSVTGACELLLKDIFENSRDKFSSLRKSK